MKFRSEEIGMNKLFLSGRIVSELFTGYEEIVYKNKRTTFNYCKFVILVKGDVDNVIAVVMRDKSMIHTFTRTATKGCRVVLEGEIHTRKRHIALVKSKKLESHIVEILITKVVNVFDTQYEKQNFEKYLLEQNIIQNKIKNGDYPSLDEFDNMKY